MNLIIILKLKYYKERRQISKENIQILHKHYNIIIKMLIKIKMSKLMIRDLILTDNMFSLQISDIVKQFNEDS